jgi:hypothetical protein
MIVVVSALSSVPGYFSAALDGIEIVAKSRQPMLEASRALLTTENSTHAIAMVHSGSSVIALTGILGHCARLEVSEGPSAPFFRPYRPVIAT